MTKAKFYNYLVTEEMADHVQLYVDYVRNLMNETKGVLAIEHRVHLKTLHPDLYGTCDAIVYEDFGTLHVIDFKYGAGIPVEVEGNEQVMYYALGALELGDFEKVVLHIVQPRAEHEAGPIRSWSTTPAVLVKLRAYGSGRAKAAPLARLQRSVTLCRCERSGAKLFPELHKSGRRGTP
jgi:hypothetical protein